jgi:tetratricopeptide (TPR) repeat protein
MFFKFLSRPSSHQAFGFIVFLILCVHVEAQTTKKLPYLYQEKLQKADENYNLFNYKTAIELYEQVLSQATGDTSIICKIANCCRLENNAKDAESWYRMALTGNENTISALIKLQFAQVLTINGKYDEALYWFKSYYKTISSDKRAVEAIQSIENISKLFYDTMFYVVYPVSINTEYAEFSPTYYKDGVVFLTDRNNPKSGLFNRYFSAIDESGNFGAPTKFSTGIKTDYNEGSVTFYDNYRRMVFSQNYSPEKISRKKINDIPLQLFYAQLDSNQNWKEGQLLSFEDKNYSYSQPSITGDGKTLYFSSNVPGGRGGTDIYVSKFVNGGWGEPVNLGSRINTKGDEMFPFIYQDTVLYFASNGHGGLGGLDLFKVNLKDTGVVENLGVPMNSGNDDFGIIVDRDGLSGYFSSNRPNGSGEDDIYKFKVIRITVTIKIIDDSTNLPVSNADIYPVGGNDVKKIGHTDSAGLCTMVIPVCKSFQVRMERKNYESKTYTFESVKSPGAQVVVIKLKTEEEEKVVLTDDNNKPISDTAHVVYKVQVLASRVPAPEHEQKRRYRGDMQITRYYEDAWYKYSIGEYASYEEAKKCLFSSKVHDAFIIAYVNQKKVHISIAKAATKETSVKSPEGNELLNN